MIPVIISNHLGTMVKLKRITLSTLQLSYHPITLSLTSADQFECEQLPDLSMLSTTALDTLLAQIVLPVCATEIEHHYALLAPSPLFFLLQRHPNAQQCQVQLSIYANPNEIINTLLFTLPSLQYRYQTGTPEKLSRRLAQAKLVQYPHPSKRELAQLANISPSALRHR